MRKIKEKIGKLLILFCACLSIGAVANAADKASTDVEITIEAEMPAETTEADENTKNAEQKKETIQTGDSAAWVKYAVALGAAIIVAACCIWKKKKGMLAVCALFLTMLFANRSVLAADTTENVSVTIPTSIAIAFDETGETRVDDFEVNNQSLVPITIEKIKALECNDWRLVEHGSDIPVNTKKIVFEIEGKSLIAGENIVSIPVAEDTSQTMDICVERGAWTTSSAKETALKLEFEYTLGKKEFELRFDTNGSGETVATKKVFNGDTVDLPTLERDGYVFAGWEDDEGNLYIDQFVMPIGDTTLKAKWKEEIAYAIYSASDTSLRFIRSAETIQAGDTYNGRVVTDVFTGFEEDVYTSQQEVPWYDGQYYNQRIITKIIFEDVIKPKSTAYWFRSAYDCTSMDVRKLDTSNVTDMSYMCEWVGSDAATFTITGINQWDVSNVKNMRYAFFCMGFNTPNLVLDLSGWNVSKVTNMYRTFKGIGYYATKFSLGDLSKWDVSNVTDMGEMFMEAGQSASWSLNLSKWNVGKVKNYYGFKKMIESKITEPNWVY